MKLVRNLRPTRNFSSRFFLSIKLGIRNIEPIFAVLDEEPVFFTKDFRNSLTMIGEFPIK